MEDRLGVVVEVAAFHDELEIRRSEEEQSQQQVVPPARGMSHRAAEAEHEDDG